MTSSRERILSKLRKAREPFPDAPPRPDAYLPVTVVEDTSSEGLLRRFAEELERLRGQAHVVSGDAEARAKVLELLRAHEANHVLAWDFQYIPVEGLRQTLEEAGVGITYPDLHVDERAAHAQEVEQAGAGLIGADAAAASTGTLIVSTAPGKGRVPTVLPPVLIAIITLDQILPRVESWLARERAHGMPTVKNSANICFISGPSRTGDIEMQLVLGVHGSGVVHVVVKR